MDFPQESVHQKPARFVQKQNISEDIVTLIKQQILQGELNPGDRIIETKLARELGVSQTPVREAIRQLQGEGVVTVVPNKGPMVHQISEKDVFEIYSVRSMLEGLAIRLACEYATAEEIERLEHFYDTMIQKLHDDSITTLLPDSTHIHQTIIHLSRHSRLLAMYSSISFQIALVNRILGAQSTKQKEVDSHAELIDALKQRDPATAESVMRRHIYNSYREFMHHAVPPATIPLAELSLWL